MNCKYLKRKINKKVVCTLDEKRKVPNCCKNCKNKEFIQCKEKRNSIINKKSTKLKKLESNRSSLFTNNKNKCMFCGSTYKLTWHEIFGGKNRQNSIKYKLCLRMCLKCHQHNQNNKEFNDFWHKEGQAMFEKEYPNLSFKDIFKKTY